MKPNRRIKYQRARAVRERSSGYSRPSLNTKITTAEDVYVELSEYRECDREHFIAITLDGASRIIKIRVISIGTLNQSLVHPREVFRPAILDNAAGIIVAHNHPSGQTFPSVEDKQITKRLQEAGKIIGIELIDHVILTGDDFYSFREEGLL